LTLHSIETRWSAPAAGDPARSWLARTISPSKHLLLAGPPALSPSRPFANGSLRVTRPSAPGQPRPLTRPLACLLACSPPCPLSHPLARSLTARSLANPPRGRPGSSLAHSPAGSPAQSACLSARSAARSPSRPSPPVPLSLPHRQYRCHSLFPRALPPRRSVGLGTSDHPVLAAAQT
jgi:hypothetical protein